LRVLAVTQLQRHSYTDRQMQSSFIICPMLCAVAMGQIKTILWCQCSKLTVIQV